MHITLSTFSKYAQAVAAVFEELELFFESSQTQAPSAPVSSAPVSSAPVSSAPVSQASSPIPSTPTTDAA